jgi:hypothetical protein
MNRVSFLLVATLLTAHLSIGAHCVTAQPPRPGTNANADADPSERSVDSKPAPAYASVRIEGVPHVRQKPDFCGEACAAMYLGKLGQRADQDDVWDQSGMDPELGRGCYTRELWRALTRIGFDVGAVWYQIPAEENDDALGDRFRAMHADLLDGIPSIVCMHYDDSPEATEHFRLILGYDAKTDEVLYHEPAIADGAYRRMPRTDLFKLWPLKYDETRWTVIRFRLKHGVLRDVHATAKFTSADYAQHVMQVRKRASDEFTVIIQKPFVVAGDEPAATVRSRANGTIRWATERLKRSYFPEDPDDILSIWLFKDKESYDKHTEEIFGDWPDTPFGYFSHTHKALIMNIDTGGGTLVHEIVHPFMASNFPECPAWFNEGLASLYEQCTDNRGRIWGRTNWRLAGLQKAIQAYRDQETAAAEQEAAADDSLDDAEGMDVDSEDAGESASDEAPPVEVFPVPTFRTLCSTTTYQFYRRDPGTNYSQARYLCYYLQQHGLLERYYQQFRRDVRVDPTGYETLKSILGLRTDADMERFKTTWEDWILTLRYP